MITISVTSVRSISTDLRFYDAMKGWSFGFYLEVFSQNLARNGDYFFGAEKKRKL